MSIQDPNGLPADFSKGPEQLANEINQAAKEMVANNPGMDPNAAVHALTELANEQANIAVNGAPPAKEEPEQHPVEYLIQVIYETLTPELRAILSSGIQINIDLTQAPDGTLSIDVHPAEKVVRIDLENKKVYKAPDAIEEKKPEASAVSPVGEGEPSNPVGAPDPQVGADLGGGPGQEKPQA
jgi:hypothetical protein